MFVSQPIILLQRYKELHDIGREEASILHHAIINRVPYVFINEDDLEGARERYNIDLFVGSVEGMAVIFNGNIPKPDYYPTALFEFFSNRNIRKGTLSLAKEIVSAGGSVFVKPEREWKSFTGFVARAISDFVPLASFTDDYQVWLSDEIDIKCEFRIYVCNGEILAVCQYTAEEDYSLDTKQIERSIHLLKESNYQYDTYAVDFALTPTDELVLIEMNNAFAIGKYKGISDSDYYKFLKYGFERLTSLEKINDI